MNTLAQQSIARFLIRNGEYKLDSMPGIIDVLTLPDIETIETLILFPVVLTRDKERGWLLSCPLIQDVLHEYFYFGQSTSNKTNIYGESTIDNPTEWIAKWRKGERQ